MCKVLVIGSANTDMVIKTDHFPAVGETVIGGSFYTFSGGKGANQAVAASRVEGNVTFSCKLGTDSLGDQLISLYQKEKIKTDYCFRDEQHPSGVALITIDTAGQNTIVVAPGANYNLTKSDILENDLMFQDARIVLVQLEIPIETIEEIAKICARKTIPLILNPAPARALSNELIKSCYLITPNETELEILTGLKIETEKDIETAANTLIQKGATNVIVTLGAKGIYYHGTDGNYYLPAKLVEAIDTTAAGDVFNGVLAASLAANVSLKSSIQKAIKAAGLSVTRLGAQSSAPYSYEL